MSSIIHSSEQNFSQDVLTSAKPALVYFWAEWCGPCKMMSPNMEEFAQNNDAVQVVKIDVDANQALASQYKIMSIPHLLLFKNGSVAKQSAGLLTPEQIKNFID